MTRPVWKNERKVRAWLFRASQRWGTPIKVYVCGVLCAEALGANDKSELP